MLSDPTGQIVLLRCARKRSLAKTLLPGGVIQDYDFTKSYDAFTRPLSGMDDLKGVIARLLGKPTFCAIAGGLIDGPSAQNIRRLCHPDPETGDPATITDVPRRWLALDVDSLRKPENVPAADVAACARIAIAALPREFQGVRCIATATAGHGLKPGIRLRLWFWLSRTLMTAEIKRWLRDAPVDSGLFSAAQIIYTARPLVAPGVVDPIPNRLADIEGLPEVSVPPIKAPTPLSRLAPRRRQSANFISPLRGETLNDADLSLAQFLLGQAVMRVLGVTEGARHATVVRECAGLTPYVRAGIIPESALRHAIRDAGTRIGLDAPEIEGCLNWALRQAGVRHDAA